MKRRDFIRLLLASSIAQTVDVEKLLWTPTKTIFIPSKKQIEFIYGIPYHEFNSTVGTWLGISRTEYPELKSLYSKITKGEITVVSTRKYIQSLEIK